MSNRLTSWPLFVVVSNVLNFMAERVIDSMPVGSRCLIVHVGKTADQIDSFRHRTPETLILPGTNVSHGAVIDTLMSGRLMVEDSVMFVDHDIVASVDVLSSLSNEMSNVFYSSPSAYIIAQRHEPHKHMLCPYVFRTVPMFMVRPSARCDVGWSCSFDPFMDTGQNIPALRPESVVLMNEFVSYNEFSLSLDMDVQRSWPFKHWTSSWMDKRLSGHLLNVWNRNVSELMGFYGDISEPDAERMHEFPVFWRWLFDHGMSFVSSDI